MSVQVLLTLVVLVNSANHQMGIPEFLDSERKSWTLDSGCWTLDAESWTLDAGRWTLDGGLSVLDAGLWTMDVGI